MNKHPEMLKIAETDEELATIRRICKEGLASVGPALAEIADHDPIQREAETISIMLQAAYDIHQRIKDQGLDPEKIDYNRETKELIYNGIVLDKRATDGTQA